ncbi:DEAD/DEAH box helicase [Leadbettera azotonutricia]|uniref:DEAD/DEAH box helicase n=1 Tax=Leadbettera azotonutricia TaxID=150829 RepID=UPI00030BC02B|nr:DEAD/DEAH box helicase [Leadbettera azotonutricia]
MLPFHPLINSWFTDTYGKPTAVQTEAWPLIASGEHVLALAPTGSGKTLTGFLAAISRFAEGIYPADKLSVLYVSPLKALNEDIRRNLTEPLEGIKTYFEKAGETFPAVRVETRSGDTPQSERRRFLLRPPSILALTPESLGILLLNPKGRNILSNVRYVILDEIHTAIGTKRGCFLSCQIDRLAMSAGEFQRVGLSATVKPPEVAAAFAGGLKAVKPGRYEPRKVHIVAPKTDKRIDFSVIFPDEPEVIDETKAQRYGRRYTALIHFLIQRIRTHRSDKGAFCNEVSRAVLVFTDSRRRAERISFLINQDAGETLAFTHHGSLSKEVRRAVEKGLTEGTIPCVVATGSLELGIDIGNVDEVILAGSPGASSTALQRIGRSGHGVGMTSKGCLIPFHGLDLLQAAAISGAVEERELEDTKSIENPLDLLAQIILSLCTEKDWNEDELYDLLRGFYVYRSLSRSSYDSVVKMLTGAYEETRLRELKRRIFRDDETGMLAAAPGALLLLYSSGGVIASRGYYSLRLAPGTEGAGTKIGELDEEFVWERRLGDVFDFGNSSWKITAIGAEAVEAVPLPHGADYAPFWKADSVYRSPVLARRSMEILEQRNSGPLEDISGFSREAMDGLDNFLASQKSFQGKIPLPGPNFFPIEIIDDPTGRGDAYSVILHTFRGGAINYPLSMALARELEAEFTVRVEAVPDDNAILLRLPRSIGGDPGAITAEALKRLCRGEAGEKRFMERLESSGVFGAAFREAAERSLLLPRSPFGKRIPLWVIRQRSKRLFDAVSSYRDFPAAAEAWRVCLNEQFDMNGFRSFLEDIKTNTITVDCFRTRQPSPFSRELAWAETNTLMYEYDERPDLMGPPSGNKNAAGPSLSDQVITEAMGNASLRPPLASGIVKNFSARLKRELPGWAPDDALTLCEWVKERVAIPSNNNNEEWEALLGLIPPELKEEWKNDPTLGGRLVLKKKADISLIVHREWEKRLEKNPFPGLGQWLRYEGPLPLARISEVFGLSQKKAEEAALALEEAGELAQGVTVIGETTAPSCFAGSALICDRENLELLLRLSRRKRRPEIKERAAPLLVPFLALRQGLLSHSEKTPPWEKLSGFILAAKLWETEIFPARAKTYRGEILDQEIRDGRLCGTEEAKKKSVSANPGIWILRKLTLILMISQKYCPGIFSIFPEVSGK